MFDSKYSNFLTVLLVLVIIAIIGLIAFLGYDYYQKYYISKETSDYVDKFNENTEQTPSGNITNTETNNNGEEVKNPLDEVETVNGGSSSSSGKKKTYKGYNVIGTIEIPKTNLKYPVLEETTKTSIEVSVAYLYGPGLNQVGNTTIVGHNYRNGLFFSNNKKLSNGDKIYITDLNGNKVTYVIYNKYETTPEDADYMTRDTEGRREISLSTCTDNSKARIIIWAKEEK